MPYYGIRRVEFGTDVDPFVQAEEGSGQCKQTVVSVQDH